MAANVFRWAQNEENRKRLKKSVQIFDSTSKHYQKLKNSLVPQRMYADGESGDVLEKIYRKSESFTFEELIGYGRHEETSDALAKYPKSLISLSIYPENKFEEKRAWPKSINAIKLLKLIYNLNFVSYNAEDDSFTITELGK